MCFLIYKCLIRHSLLHIPLLEGIHEDMKLIKNEVGDLDQLPIGLIINSHDAQVLKSFDLVEDSI